MNFATVGPSGPMSREPSLVFVCDSNTGSSTFTDTAAIMPLRMSEYSKFLLKNSFMVLDTDSLNAARWVPPWVVCCPLTKE